MNVHHLELFYYVARHGGISRAVRHIPYGIQQPAVSGQMLALEQDLGKRLFERTPFSLTPAGARLYEYVRPFFEEMDAVARELRQEAAPHLRIGASEIVLRDHLPPLLAQLQQRHPKLRVTLRSGFQADMELALQERAIDLAVTPLERKPPPRIQCRRLVALPLVLVVPRKLKLGAAEELWAEGTVDHPLICLPASETVTRAFRRGLQQRRVEWPLRIEASSLDLITRYVANGYGIGVSVDVPEIVRHREVRRVELPGFAPVEIAALWKNPTLPLVRELLDEMQRYAESVWPESRGAEPDRA